MRRSSQPSQRRRAAPRALLVYVVGWLGLGAALVFVVSALLRGVEDDVALPPVRETELPLAATKAGCVLRSGDQAGGDPPVSGPPADPAPAGVYDDPPGTTALVGALRRGIIVIQYRPEVADDQIEALRQLQAAVPRGTIVTPNLEMRFALAVTGWHRLLGCRELSDGTIDAIRLFHGRYIGSGPDSSG